MSTGIIFCVPMSCTMLVSNSDILREVLQHVVHEKAHIVIAHIVAEKGGECYSQITSLEMRRYDGSYAGISQEESDVLARLFTTKHHQVERPVWARKVSVIKKTTLSMTPCLSCTLRDEHSESIAREMMNMFFGHPSCASWWERRLFAQESGAWWLRLEDRCVVQGGTCSLWSLHRHPFTILASLAGTCRTFSQAVTAIRREMLTHITVVRRCMDEPTANVSTMERMTLLREPDARLPPEAYGSESCWSGMVYLHDAFLKGGYRFADMHTLASMPTPNITCVVPPTLIAAPLIAGKHLAMLRRLCEARPMLGLHLVFFTPPTDVDPDVLLSMVSGMAHHIQSVSLGPMLHVSTGDIRNGCQKGLCRVCPQLRLLLVLTGANSDRHAYLVASDLDESCLMRVHSIKVAEAFRDGEKIWL